MRRSAVGWSVWLGLIGLISLWNVPLTGYLFPTGLFGPLLLWRGNWGLLQRKDRVPPKNAGREVSKYEPDLVGIRLVDVVAAYVFDARYCLDFEMSLHDLSHNS